MIVWINGAHGVGKSSVARRLAADVPGARLFDPERIGFALRRRKRNSRAGDFQDLPEWRRLTIDRLAAAGSAEILIVPMTLADPVYFEEIVGGLRARGADLRHFTLTAPSATIERRLRGRLDWPWSRRWALERVESRAAALAAPRFERHVETDGRSVAEIAAEIRTVIAAPAPAG